MDDPRTGARESAGYGCRQELKRALSAWAVSAIGFAAISPAVGVHAGGRPGFVFAGPARIRAVVVVFSAFLAAGLAHVMTVEPRTELPRSPSTEKAGAL